MKCLKPTLAMAIAIGIVSATVTAGDEEIDTGPAMSAAQAWLAEVDSGRYGQSWEDASEYLRNATPKEQWETTLRAARAKLGLVIARKMRGANYVKDPPNAPAGEYLLITYDTHFENKPLAAEIVTPTRDKDGKWKVADYSIR